MLFGSGHMNMKKRLLSWRRQSLKLQCYAISIQMKKPLFNVTPRTPALAQHSYSGDSQLLMHYAQIENELLAVVFGMERFNQYKNGRMVFVESDHKPLTRNHLSQLQNVYNVCFYGSRNII